MCSDVETHIVHKHTNTTHTGPVHSTSWTMGAGLTAKSLWYPHYEESQPGHETWMTLFPKTRTHGHRRTQKYKYRGNERTTVSKKHPLWIDRWHMHVTLSSRNVTLGVSQDNNGDEHSDSSNHCCFPGWMGITVKLECVKVFPHPVFPSMTRHCQCPHACNLDYY